MYRTRLVSTRIPEREKRQLAELAGQRSGGEWDPDACRAMLFAVLETAIRDCEYLESVRDSSEFSVAQNKRVRSMVEDNHPHDFFDSIWFEQICQLLGLNHSAVKKIVDTHINDDPGGKRPVTVGGGGLGGEMPFV